MSKRLDVLLPDDDYDRLQSAARERSVTVAEFVRASIRERLAGKSSLSPEERRAVIERAMSYAFPAPDIEEMLDEIERGR